MAQPLALFSVYKKDRTKTVVTHARALLTRMEEWEIVATHGTCAFLLDALPGYHSRIHTTEQLFAACEILGGIFKTLDPRIHAALYATPEQLKDAQSNPDHPAFKELYRLIDLVYIRLHADRTDLGGFSLLRTAVEGERLTVTEPDLFDGALNALQARAEQRTDDERQERDALRDATELHLAQYILRTFNARRRPGLWFRLNYNADPGT